MRTEAEVEAKMSVYRLAAKKLYKERRELTQEIDTRVRDNNSEMHVLDKELKQLRKNKKGGGRRQKPDMNLILFWQDKTVRLDTRTGMLGYNAWEIILKYGLPESFEIQG